MKYRYNQFNTNEFEAHRLEYDLIKEGSRVLDIGCATGFFARELRKKHCETWGVDNNERALTVAKKHCRKVAVADLDKKISLPFPKKYFDYVVALDVIEHLTQPEYVLSAIKAHLKPDGKIIVSTPNIAHAMVRWMLVRGEFEYSDTGILDKTHVHFYHRRSLAGLLRKEGYRVEKIIPTNGMCKVPFLYKITDRLPLAWQYGLVKLVPDLFAFQFIAVARVAKR